jgi:hypothetical protein
LVFIHLGFDPKARIHGVTAKRRKRAKLDLWPQLKPQIPPEELDARIRARAPVELPEPSEVSVRRLRDSGE